MKKRLNIVGYTLLGITIIVLLFLQFSTQQDLRKANARAKESRDSTFLFKNRVKVVELENGQLAYDMKVLQGSEAEARKLAGTYEGKFKRLQAVYNVKVGVSIKGLQIPFDDITRPSANTNAPVDTGANVTALASCDTSKEYCQDTTQLTVPRHQSYSSQWFYFSQLIRYNGTVLDSVGFNPGNLTFILGDKKRGGLRWPEPTIRVVPENPYMVITYGNNVVVDERKKPKRGLWAAGGATGAAIVIFVLEMFLK